MQNDIKIGLTVSSNGTADTELKKAKALKAAYDEAARSATNLGGTAGSRAAAARAMGGSAGMSGTEYGQMRGTAGTTGASARDFANQAQGLGGLVRLYATFAANLFAVSAAFTALKAAADTTNMIKGLDQLGARSGMALGTLSKQLVEVTDGAISMREAMETVTKATSSGLNSKQVLELGNIAKKASQALGVDMSDAISRLTRGITKLEPELLDELGLFSKLDPSVQKYAQSIGRAASSLTDFERRQAFAIAVLEEGNQKFGTLELDANPYAKFLATLKNVGQSVLEVVNTAVIPLVSYLSQSPTALLTVLGAVATLIVKQALPAFGQFRAGLESSAEKARDRAIERAKDAAVAQEAISASVKKAAEARVEKEVANVVAAEKRIQDIKAGSINKQSSLYKILSKDLESITDKELKRIETSAKGLESRGLTDQAKAYREAAAAIRSYQTESKAYEKALETETKARQNATKWYSIESITLSTAERAKQQAVRSSIISNAAYQASLVGVTRAMIAVNAAIVEQGIKGFDAFTLRVKAGAAAIGGALSALGAAFNRFLGAIGILATLYSVFDLFLDKASSAVGKFDSAVSKVESTVKNLQDTYENLYRNDPFSAQATQARGNALTELALGFEELTKRTKEAQEAISGSWYSRFKEFIGISGVERNFGKGIATQVTALIKSIDDPAALSRITNTVTEQLKITELTFENIEAAAKRLGASSPELKKLEEAIKGIATEAKIAGIASATFAESYKKVTDQIAQINQKFAVSDDLANFAINSSNALNDLNNLLSQGVIKSADQLVQVLQGIGRGTSIFGEKLSPELSQLADEASRYKNQLSDSAKESKKLAEELERLNKVELDRNDRKFLRKGARGQEERDDRAFEQAVAELRAERERVAVALAQAQRGGLAAETKLNEIGEKVGKALPQALAAQTDLLAVRLAAQISKGSTQFLQGIYASFDAIPELVAKSSDLKLKEIDAQVENTKAMRSLTTATILSAAQLKVTRAETAAKDAQTDSQRETANTALAEARTELNLLEKAISDPLAALKLLGEEEKNQTEIGKRLGATIRELSARTVEYNKTLSDLSKQRLSEELQKQVNVSNARFKQQQNENKLKLEDLKLDGEKLKVLAAQENLSLDLKDQVTNQINLNRQKQIELEFEDRKLAATREYAEQIIRLRNLPAADFQKNLPDLQNRLNQQLDQASAQKALELEKSRLDAAKALSATTIERINREQAEFDRESSVVKSRRETELEIAKLRLETEQGVQQANIENLGLTERIRLEIAYQNTLKTALYENERAKILANEEFAREQVRNTFEIRKLLAADTGEDGLTGETQRRIDLILAGEAAQKAAKDNTIKLADAQLQKSIGIADAVKQAGLEQARFNDIINNSRSLAEALGGAFGTVGEKIGEFVVALAEVGVQNEKNAKALADNLKRQEESGSPSIELLKEERDLRKKAEKDELNGNIRVVASAKSVFKEKTAAYKILAGIEKAMHIAKIAMTIKEMLTDTTATGVSVANSATRSAASVVEAGIDGVKAVVKAIASLPFPLNIAAGAATAAVVGALLSSIGGKEPKVQAGTSAAERQEVQGTGQQYVNGQLVTRAGGVLGDPTEKADSITSSIDRLSEEFFGSFGSGSSKIVRSLQDIEKNTGDTVKALLGQVSGFGGNVSQFGTIEGSSGGGLFGLLTKTTTTIQDAGIKVTGTLQQLAEGLGIFQQYEVVTTTKKRLFGLSKSTRTSTNFRDLEQDAVEGLSSVFASMKSVLEESAIILEGSGSQAVQAISGLAVNLDVSLKGLTGKEAIEAVLAELSVAINQGAQKIFPYIEQYQRIGEEYFETVARIVKESETLAIGLEILGIRIANLSTQAAIAFEQDLIDKLGGIESAAESINVYFDKFLSKEQQFRIRFNQLTRVFTDAGRTLPQTKTEFTNLINSLDIVGSEYDRETFALLLNNAETYNELLELQSSILGSSSSKLADLTKSLREFRQSLLVGSTSTLTPIERYAQAKADFESVRGLALTGNEEALGKLQGASQTFLTISRELFASGAQYTTDFQTVLDTLETAGNLSQETIDIGERQLTVLNDQLGTLGRIERLLGPTATEAVTNLYREVLNREPEQAGLDYWTNRFGPIVDANERAIFTGTAQAEINAGRAAVTDLYREILNRDPDPGGLDYWSRQFGTTIDAAERATFIATAEAELAAQRMQQVDVPSYDYNYYAKGGLASAGLAMVGEEGPELVDFATPGRVYTAEETRGMFTPVASTTQTFKQMVAELQDLREEVTQLRKEQQKQTGDMIITNYDAQQKMADQIAESVIKTVSDKNWQDKTKPMLN